MKNSFNLVLVCKGLSNDDVGMASGIQPYFKRYSQEPVPERSISLKKVGGATVERLCSRFGSDPVRMTRSDRITRSDGMTRSDRMTRSDP